MAWKCYSCGTKNPKSADTCKECGGNVAQPSTFYIHWIFGSAVFFIISYLVGTFLGGTLLESIVAPTTEEIFEVAKATTPALESIEDMKPDQKQAARGVAMARALENLSPVSKTLTYWFLPFIMVFITGVIVAFVSDGKTIIEAGLGSIIGQVGGYCVQRFAFDSDAGFIAIGVMVVAGLGLSILGAWIGERLQERHEQAG